MEDLNSLKARILELEHELKKKEDRIRTLDDLYNYTLKQLEENKVIIKASIMLLQQSKQ